MNDHVSKYDTAAARWAGVGPYYAMFPASFANQVIDAYTCEGDTIIDPFAGRGTSLFSAASKGRHAIGVEINPVGWVYATTKLNPASRWHVERRAEEIGALARRFRKSAEKMPEFFQWCFCPEVLAFLLAARRHLDWRLSRIDRTLMALLLVDLHGKRTAALSNQMRQTKAMSPNYAVRWWKKHHLGPPERDPIEFIRKKCSWRYARGTPQTCESKAYLGDSSHGIGGLATITRRLAPKGARLLFTSPPYLGVTNYHYDQWLRLWLLGGSSYPQSLRDGHRGKFENPERYCEMLFNALSRSKTFLAPNATIYVRTDARTQTALITEYVLKSLFARHRLERHSRPLNGKSQTRLFGNGDPRIGEIDLILIPQ
jgi:hypothetical protein